MQWIRSVIFGISYIGALVLFSIAGLFLVFWKRSYVLSFYYADLLDWLLKNIVGIKTNIIGKDLIPKGQSYVVASSHQSAWETLAFQKLFSPISTVVKREVTWIPIFGWALKIVLRPITVNRSKKKESLLRVLSKGKLFLEEGRNILIFPEGTRVLFGLGLKPLARGVTQLACRSETLLVPVVNNSGFCWGRPRLLKKSGMITCIIGEPIVTKGRSVDDVHAELEVKMKDLHSRLANIPI